MNKIKSIIMASIFVGLGSAYGESGVIFQTLDKGNVSGHKIRKVGSVITTQEDWGALWELHQSARAPQDRMPLPSIDFEHQTVIAVFQGEKTTGGYEITITEIKGQPFEVFVEEVNPDPNCLLQQSLTQPYHIVKVPLALAGFNFVVNNRIIGCENKPPQVDAGADQSILLDQKAVLTGTVEDDGLPNPPGHFTTLWSKKSGPGGVSFDNAASMATSASFSEHGTYVLTLEANDGEKKASDDVQIAVERAGAPTDPPIVQDPPVNNDPPVSNPPPIHIDPPVLNPPPHNIEPVIPPPHSDIPPPQQGIIGDDGRGHIYIDRPQADTCSVTVFISRQGQLIQEFTHTLSSQQDQIPVSLQGLAPGAYRYRVEGCGLRKEGKVIYLK